MSRREHSDPLAESSRHKWEGYVDQEDLPFFHNPEKLPNLPELPEAESPQKSLSQDSHSESSHSSPTHTTPAANLQPLFDTHYPNALVAPISVQPPPSHTSPEQQLMQDILHEQQELAHILNEVDFSSPPQAQMFSLGPAAPGLRPHQTTPSSSESSDGIVPVLQPLGLVQMGLVSHNSPTTPDDPLPSSPLKSTQRKYPLPPSSPEENTPPLTYAPSTAHPEIYKQPSTLPNALALLQSMQSN